jgi:hypothetical protein
MSFAAYRAPRDHCTGHTIKGTFFQSSYLLVHVEHVGPQDVEYSWARSIFGYTG